MTPQNPVPNATDPESNRGELEARRLELEFERLKFDRQKAAIELRLKRREARAPPKKWWVDLVGNPLTLAIVGGFITLMTTTVTGHFTTLESINAETAKARQALQTDLIKKFVENPNPQTVRANLRFLVDVGLVPNYADNLQAFLAKNSDSQLPSSFTPAAGSLASVHTDEDAIDLVLKEEGGYVDNPADPDGATNHGITLKAFSDYLGKTASKDDLRGMSVATARDYYKKQYLDDISGYTSVRVKAAYLNLAVNMGKAKAAKIFQTAANKLGTSIVIDGMLGPSTQQFINATDPDLFIETADCEAAKTYIKLASTPSGAQFLVGWIKRLQRFSPVDLKSVCPELPSPSSPPGQGEATP
jgi:lysozyme family protein